MRRIARKLRERPHDERRAIAAGVSIAVSGVLLTGWFAFFMHNLAARIAPVDQSQPASGASAAPAAVTELPVAAPNASDSGVPAAYLPSGGASSSDAPVPAQNADALASPD